MAARRIAAIASTLVRWLVRLQPREFHQRFGRDVVADIDDDLAAAVSLGPRATLVAASRALTDTARGLAIERVRHLRRTLRKDTIMFTALTTDLPQDVRFAVRSLARQPRFTMTALLILTLAIGTTTTIFTVVNAVLLRPLPYEEPDRLVAVASVLESGEDSRSFDVVALSDLAEWRRHTRTFSSLGAFAYTQLPIRVAQQPHFPVTALVDATFLPTLGVAPAFGRYFDEASDTAREKSAVVSHAFWRQAFSADPSAVGRTFLVDGEPYVVRGVLAPDFQFPRSDASYHTRPIELVILSAAYPGFPPQARQWFGIGRLAPGVTLERAEQELQSIARRVDDPGTREIWSARLAPLHDETTRTARRPVVMVFAISLVLVLIASSNLTNLLVSRGVDRVRELSIRKALGSTTGRLVRLLLVESLLLALAGCAVGLFLARLTLDALVAMSPVHLPVTQGIGIDGTVLAFALGLCTVTALAVGVFPALHVSWTSDEATRHAGFRVSGSPGAARVQQIACVVQVALGVTLVTAAGLLAHSLIRLNAVEPGFETDRVIGFNMSVPTTVSTEKRRAFYAGAIDEVRRIPGVESAGLITFLPPEVRSGVFMNVAIDREPGEGPRRRVNTLVASADGLSTLGMPILRGRNFSASDNVTSEPVIIVNETFAREFFSTADVIDRHMGTGFDGLKPVRRIVGVVRDSRDRGPARVPIPTVYLPFTQYSLPYTSMAVRVTTDPVAITPVIRDRLNRLNPNVPLTDFQSVETRMAEAVREPRFYTVMAVVCASMAVLFVTLGLYGLISYSVSRRRPELGIRLALGARPQMILRLVLVQGLRLALAGIALGVLLSFLTSRALSAFLFQVEPNDPATLAGAGALVLVVTLLACYGPARRAAGVDPLGVLRSE